MTNTAGRAYVDISIKPQMLYLLFRRCQLFTVKLRVRNARLMNKRSTVITLTDFILTWKKQLVTLMA